MAKAKYNFDCIQFKGYKPCPPKKMCQTCDEYTSWEKRILIIKLGALGDVLRTTPLLFAFHRKYPKAHITWVTKSNAQDMLSQNPRIHRLLFIDDKDNGTALRLLAEEFDELHNYDKEDAAIGLASLVKAKEKYGFYLNPQGQMAPLNSHAEYSFDLGLSDPLKFFENKKSYQKLSYESSNLPVPKPMDPYDFSIRIEDEQAAQKVVQSAYAPHVQGPLIGLNTGSGRVFRTKQWLEENFYELAMLLKERLKARILLLGGADEEERNLRLASQLTGVAHYPGSKFTIRQFAGLLKACDLVVTGDTLAMHLALAMQVPTVALFGSTCDQEVEMYDCGEKIVSRPACSPCYKNECDQIEWMKCMKNISPLQVHEAIARNLK